MHYKYTLQQIRDINHGDIQDAKYIIDFYIGNGLIKTQNSQDDCYISENLKPNDLRFKSKFRKVLEFLKESDTVGGIFIKWSGWILFIVLFFLK